MRRERRKEEERVEIGLAPEFCSEGVKGEQRGERGTSLYLIFSKNFTPDFGLYDL
jgi:hypothetical protein